MINTLIAGVLVSSVLTATPNIPKTYLSYSYNQVIPNDSYATYVVKDGDYLSKIAEEIYGSEDYWTNIWNDNPELEDPSKLEENMVLQIRENKTLLPEVLNTELSSKVNPQAEIIEATYTYTAESGAEAKQVVAEILPTPTQVMERPTAAPVMADTPKSLTDEQISYLGSCEAGMDPAKNTGNGYYGAFQFSYGTWKSMNTGYERADLAPIEVQKAAVQRLVQRSSIFTQFPACAKRMRSIGMI